MSSPSKKANRPDKVWVQSLKFALTVGSTHLHANWLSHTHIHTHSLTKSSTHIQTNWLAHKHNTQVHSYKHTLSLPPHHGPLVKRPVGNCFNPLRNPTGLGFVQFCVRSFASRCLSACARCVVWVEWFQEGYKMFRRPPESTEHVVQNF